MEDMGNDPERESGLCGHPPLNRPRQHADAPRPQDQYAARHNPFVYFHSIIDDNYYCEQHDVPLTQLPADLAKARNTANFSFITPDLCNDGHDEPCADGEPGGLVAADAWLREWVPRITGSAAFKRDGLLLITFDEAEAEGATADASACCNQAQFPNTPNNGGPTPGHGRRPRRRRGAVAVHPAGHRHQPPVQPLLGAAHRAGAVRPALLGYAGSPDPGSFGADVFTQAP